MNNEKCKFRFHRGTLKDSLKTIIEISCKQELCDVINEKDLSLGMEIKPDDIEVKPYCKDERTKWDTFIVTVKGQGVIGFSNALFD